MKTLALLTLLSFSAWSQDQYQLKGSFGKNTITNKPIEFSLSWNEKDGLAEGLYKDDFYSTSGTMKGISGNLGRIFVITFPKESNGVRTVSLLYSAMKGEKGSALLPVSVVLRDDTGKPVTTASIEANLTAMDTVAQRQEDPNCGAGFGQLAGYCGVYTGMVSEEMDTQSKCELLSQNPKLVLDNNAELGLAIGGSEISETQVHRVGRLPSDPTGTSVDLLSRSCRPLPGTTFPGDDCKRLHLLGSFTMRGKSKHFSGTYMITDERTNISCRYSLSMDEGSTTTL